MGGLKLIFGFFFVFFYFIGNFEGLYYLFGGGVVVIQSFFMCLYKDVMFIIGEQVFVVVLQGVVNYLLLFVCIVYFEVGFEYIKISRVGEVVIFGYGDF